MMKRTTALTALAVALVAVASTFAFAAARDARSPAQLAAQARPPGPSILTDVVTAERLVKAIELQGVLQPHSTFTVSAPTRVTDADRVVVTRMPLRPGDSVTAGTLLAEVSGRPLVALSGKFPAYRDLSEGDTGPDVKQLQSALRDVLGTPRRTGVFDAQTAGAVRLLYRRLGYTVPTGSRQPAADGNQASGGAAGSSAFPSAAPKLHVKVPASEIVFLPVPRATVATRAGRVGGETTGPLLTLTFGGFDVVAPVGDEQAAQLATLPPAARGRLVLASGSHTVTFSRLKQTSAADGSGPASGGGAGGSSGGPKLAAVFSLAQNTSRGLRLGARGPVEIQTARSPQGALIVPVASLFTDAGGRTSVTVDPGSKSSQIPVEVLMTSEGKAAVRAVDGELKPGDRVLIGYQGASPG